MFKIRQKAIIFFLFLGLSCLGIAQIHAEDVNQSKGIDGALSNSASISQAEVLGPGWFMGTAEPVSPEDAEAYYNSKQSRENTLGTMGIAAFTASAATITDGIEELARALQYDPKLIYDYVHNYIDYVPYFGSLKGATLTYLDGSGNDFDQTSLMIALLRESSNYNTNIGTVQYVYGTMTIPNYFGADDYDLQHWLGVSASSSVISRLLSSGGIPAAVYYLDTTMDRVWVKAAINGTDYMFDPSFKKYEETAGINLKTAMNYDRNALLTAAGGETGTDYIRNLNDSALRSKLVEYSTNLITSLRANYPNSEMSGIIGGRNIISEIIEQYPTGLRFPYSVTAYWDNVPDAYVHKVHIQHGQIDQLFSIHDIAGKRLAITYDTGGSGSSALNVSGSSQALPNTDQKLQINLNFTKSEKSISNQVIKVGNTNLTARSTTTWDFGRINSYSSVTYSTTYSVQAGYPTATFNSWLSNNGSGAYSCTQNCGVHNVGPGQSITTSVTFSGSGQSRGTKTATLNVNISGSGYTPSTDYYNCTGFKADDPNFSPGSYGIDFGQRYLDDFADGTAKLKNNGSYTVTINGMRWTGSGSGQFQFLSGSGSGSLGAGQTRDINIRYLAGAVGVHNADIEIAFSYDGITYDYPGVTLPNVGETISAPAAQLWLDDELITQESPPVSGAGLATMTLTIDHPYSADSGAYGDQTSTYNLKRGSSYVVISDFGGSKDARLLKKRQRILEDYRTSGLSDSSREVLTETLNVMGQTWMQQTTLSDNLLAQLSNVIQIRHHRFGIMAQEEGYYVDVKTQVGSYISKNNNTSDENACFKAGSFLGSALEHGVLEQLQGVDRPAASTIKLMNIANGNGDKIFLADSGNFSTIQSQLTGYSAEDIQDFQSAVNDGFTLILPADGQLALQQWSGKGYVKFKQDVDGKAEMGMIIGGDYYGGYGAYPWQTCIYCVQNEFDSELFFPSQIRTSQCGDPIDMTTGAYVLDHEDLALGGAEPLGLHFKRYYNSDNHNEKSSLGYGWTHSYNIYLNIHSDVDAGLAMRQPVDAVASLVASVVTLDLMSSSMPAVKEWATAVLVNKWSMDELFENAVSVHLQDRVLTYIMLPDGSFNSPPGVTTKLTKQTGLYQLQERFGTVIDFNANNRVSSWTDVDGNSLTFTYSGNNLTTVTDAINRTLTLQYTGDKLTAVADSAGRTASYGYDPNDNLNTYTDPENKAWSYGYNTDHRITGQTNPLSITTVTNTYDSLGRVKQQVEPRQGGTSTTHNYYFSGFRNIREESGNQTIYFIDDKKRTVGEQNALGNSKTTQYDGQNHVVETVDAKANPSWFYYDGNHNLIASINALGLITDYNYDAQFRLTDTVDHIYHGTHLEYDSEHHPILSKFGIRYDSSLNPIDSGLYQNSSTYYANGLKNTVTDGRATMTTLTYDSYGNPDTIKVGSHPAIDYSYDSIGRMTDLTDQVTSTTSFVYDKRSLLTKKTDPLLKDTILTYDDAGRLASRKDRNNQTITYSYTPTDKPDTITYPDSSTVHFTYDQYDQLTGMQEAIGSSSYGYDAVGRLTSQTDANGFAVAYGYDAAGNLTSITYPGNKTVNYTYDALNRLKTVTNWLSQTATYNYDDAGRLTSLTNFNGTVTTYGYDNANRLTAFDNKKSDTTILASYSFTLDGNGNRTQVVQNEPLTQIPNPADVSYTYNTKKNRLLTANTTSFGYDDEGQLNSKAGGAYTFDYEHRLKSIAGTTTFYYDGSGKRLKAVRNGIETRYIYDTGGNLLAEADGNNNITKYYIYGAGLLAMVTPTNQTYCYHFNAVGSTIAMTDSTQAMVNKYSYDPFGNVVNQVEAVQQPFKFVGQHGVMTEPNGFYYMRARYYDPEVGRFISEDPIGFEGGINLYAYVLNNPVLLIDPLGLAVGDWWDLPANYGRAYEIHDQEMERFAGHHNDTGDAMRHAEWSRRTAEETNSFTAWSAGLGHEIDNWINDDQPWREGLMDLHNNSEGRNAARESRLVNPNNLRTNPQGKKGCY
ncbi:MAG: transglutaminase [Nitrospirae bacterium]|nr:transglutaminase [Nitrospirota bacterium]